MIKHGKNEFDWYRTELFLFKFWVLVCYKSLGDFKKKKKSLAQFGL